MFVCREKQQQEPNQDNKQYEYAKVVKYFVGIPAVGKADDDGSGLKTRMINH